uniref:Histone-lysine N-methyltransferase n=1 Tax=Strigamia maritima TaxID=126957 RepID=T1JED5_STRMM
MDTGANIPSGSGTPGSGTPNRAFTDTFKNILSSVLKTDLGQVLKSSAEKNAIRPSETSVQTTDLAEFTFRSNFIKIEESPKKEKDLKDVKINTPKSNESILSGRIKPTKRKMKNFKGGTYQLSIKPNSSSKKKIVSKRRKSNGESSDQSDFAMLNASYLDDRSNDISKTNGFDRNSKKSMSNSWNNIELPARDVVTPIWLKPSTNKGDHVKTWFDYCTNGSNDQEVPEAAESSSVLAPNSDEMQDIILCTCKEDISAPYDSNMEQESTCQAVDCIDDRLVGCSGVVNSTSSMNRPGRKIPFLPMCNGHAKRLRAHHCCPGCGLFCTQGVFIRCCNGENGPNGSMHLFHERCCTVSKGEALCPHCGGSSNWTHVRTRINSSRPLLLDKKQPIGNKQRSARMTINHGIEELQIQEVTDLDRPGARFKIAETGKEITSDGLPMGPDRSELEALLLNLSIEKPMNLRYTIKSFYNAAKHGDVEKILHMLAMKYNPNHRFGEYNDETALHAACANGQLITCHVLQQAGAILDCMDGYLRTPLTAAVETKQTLIVRYLIRAGVNLEARGENGMTSMHIASKTGNLDACRSFFETGKLNINLLDDGGWTALVWAAEFRHKDIARFLLDCGADPNVRDNEQNIALHWAAFSGSSEICELFLNRECDISSVNEHGDTPLHIAARQDNYDCIMLFLTRNADISAQNKEGKTPIMCCLDKNSQSWMALSMSRQLRHFAKSSISRSEQILHRDITHGKEMCPIQCVNGVDNESFPVDYLYIIENCETTPLAIDRCITSLQSCSCEDDCLANSCTCSSLSLKCWYTKEGSLLPEFNLLDPPMIFECNRACRCWKNCNNRTVQHRKLNRLQLFRTQGKGWGVRALRDISRGTFICEYVGELISDSEADQRDDDSYLFDLDNRDGETYCIDARYYGNISRFINHLCEPNLVPVKVFVDHQDLRFPRIAFFSSRDIKAYEELGFDYGEKFWIIKYKTFTCMCNTDGCKYSSHRIQELLAKYQQRQQDAIDSQSTKRQSKFCALRIILNSGHRVWRQKGRFMDLLSGQMSLQYIQINLSSHFELTKHSRTFRSSLRRCEFNYSYIRVITTFRTGQLTST